MHYPRGLAQKKLIILRREWSYIFNPPCGLHSIALLPEALSLLPKVKCVSNQNKTQIGYEFNNFCIMYNFLYEPWHSPPGLLLVAGP